MQDEDLTSAIRALVSDTQSSITGLLSVTIIDHLGNSYTFIDLFVL